MMEELTGYYHFYCKICGMINMVPRKKNISLSDLECPMKDMQVHRVPDKKKVE
jgi:hypothetical protein